MKNFYKLTLIIIASLIIIVTNMYFTPKNPNEMETPLCDFEKSVCINTELSSDLVLTATPALITAETEIEFELTLKLKPNQNIQIKSAWLEGKNMFMGKIPLFFSKTKTPIVSPLENQVTYRANTLIGACTEEQMIWQMTIVWEEDGQEKLTFFELVSFR